MRLTTVGPSPHRRRSPCSQPASRSPAPAVSRSMATGPEGPKPPLARLPGDRATAPVPLEDSSDAAWQEFSHLQSQSDSLADSGTPAPAPAARPAPAAVRPTQEPVSAVGTMLLA